MANIIFIYYYLIKEFKSQTYFQYDMQIIWYYVLVQKLDLTL